MRDILVLERLVNRIVNNQASGLILCGKRNCITLGGRDHDLLFHIMSNVPYENLKDEKFFFVPVIGGNSYEKISKIHKQNPSFSTYVMREEKSKICESDGKKEVVEGTFLKFLDVQQCSVGLVVEPRKDYFTASERDMKTHFPNYKEILHIFKKFRMELRSKYGC